MRRGAKPFTVKLTSQELVNWFLGEAVSVTAGHERFSDAADALDRYFGMFEHLRRASDFQMRRMLPRPAPLGLFVDPYALYGHFRAWLRSHELDPDAVIVPEMW
jgi:hypothetical protein